jgi:hypothetical protein
MNAYNRQLNGWKDIFLIKFSISKNILLYSTFIGAEGWDSPDKLILSDEGTLLIVGITISNNWDNPLNPKIIRYSNRSWHFLFNLSINDTPHFINSLSIFSLVAISSIVFTSITILLIIIIKKKRK